MKSSLTCNLMALQQLITNPCKAFLSFTQDLLFNSSGVLHGPKWSINEVTNLASLNSTLTGLSWFCLIIHPYTVIQYYE